MKYLPLSFALLLCVGCSKPEEPPRRTEPWLASPSANASAAAAAAPIHYEILPESGVRFSLPARRAKLTGTVPLLRGSLLLDPRDLSRSKATLELDVTRLEVTPDSLPPDADLGESSASELARRWLELGSEVPEERRRQHGRAVFQLSAVEDNTDGLDLNAFKRPARATVVGSLLLHGFRAPVRTRVQLQPIETASGARRLSIRSLEPVVLSLAAHDVGARNGAGVSEPALTERLSGVVGKTARIEFELMAEAARSPQPPKTIE